MFTKERKVLKDQEERLGLDGKICRENKQAKEIWSLKKDLKSGLFYQRELIWIDRL